MKDCDALTNVLIAWRCVVLLAAIVIGTGCVVRLCSSLKSDEKIASHGSNVSDIKIERYLKYFAITGIIGCILSSISMTGLLFSLCFFNHNADSGFRTMGILGASLVYLALYCVFVIRFLYSFANTSYAPTKLAKYWFLGCIILSLILSLLAVFISIIDQRGNSPNAIVLPILAFCVVCVMHMCCLYLYLA